MAGDSLNDGPESASTPVPQCNKRILITGSSGYVGQHLITSLGSSGIFPSESQESLGPELSGQKIELFCAYNSLPTFEADLVTVFGINETASGDQNASQSKRLHSSVVKIHSIPNIDFSNPNFVEIMQQHLEGKCDAIVHLAAMSSPAVCENNQDLAWKVNCPIELFNFSVQMNAPIIFLSTDQVYQGNKSFYVEDVDDASPINTYGMAKLGFEKVLQNGEGGLRPNPKSVILRSSLILGPATPLEHGCRKGSFPSFLQFIESRLKEGKSTDYFTNEYRSMVHVDDVIRTIKHFICQALSTSYDAQSNNGKSRVYNMGGSDRISRHDLALCVAKHLKLDSSSINGVDRPPHRSGEGVPSPPDISMDVTKLTKELGVQKMMGLEEIVRLTFGDRQ